MKGRLPRGAVYKLALAAMPEFRCSEILKA